MRKYTGRNMERHAFVLSIVALLMWVAALIALSTAMN